MDHMLTVLLATGVVAGVSGVLIPMLTAASTPERRREREAALEDQLASLR